MRKYLAELHTKPDHHKKRFALLVSASFTLILLGTWSLVKMAGDERLVAQGEPSKVEGSPFQSLIGGVLASFQSLRGDFDELKEGLEVVNFEANSEKNLNTNGQ